MNTANQRAKSEYAADFARDGYIVAEALLSASECDTLKEEARRVLDEHAAKEATVHVGAAAQSEVFRALADDPRVVEILRAILPTGVMFLSDKIVFKSSTQTFATPWHIDAFYWAGTRAKVSVWIPLDDVSAENGTLKVVRASHRQDWTPDRNTGAASNGEFGNVIEKETWAPSDEVICALPRGSAVIFSDRLAHASCPNAAGADRYTIISTYHAPAEDDEFDTQFPARHVIDEAPSAGSAT